MSARRYIRIGAEPVSDFFSWLLGEVDGRRVFVHASTGTRYVDADGKQRNTRAAEAAPAAAPSLMFANRHERRSFAARARRGLAS